jgi:hypothetical protein
MRGTKGEGRAAYIRGLERKKRFLTKDNRVCVKTYKMTSKLVYTVLTERNPSSDELESYTLRFPSFKTILNFNVMLQILQENVYNYTN